MMIDSGGAVTSVPPWFGTVPMSNEHLPRKLEANGHALRHHVVRELDFSVAARLVQVNFVVTDVMKLTEQGISGHEVWA